MNKNNFVANELSGIEVVKNSQTSSLTSSQGKSYNTVDSSTGTKTYDGPSIITKGNHKNMPSRDSSYLSTDERGHIQASSLSGDNNKANITPQARDLNHGSYLSVENGERDALRQGYSVQTEKIAFASNQVGGRSDAFIVNDSVKMGNGQAQGIQHSFANMMNAQQEGLNHELMDHSDLLDVSNPSDGLRENNSSKQYADLMERTDSELFDLRDEYQMDAYVSVTPSADANEIWAEAGAQMEEEASVDTTTDWNLSSSDMVGGIGSSADLETTANFTADASLDLEDLT